MRKAYAEAMADDVRKTAIIAELKLEYVSAEELAELRYQVTHLRECLEARNTQVEEMSIEKHDKAEALREAGKDGAVFSESWCRHMAALEGDSEIGVGGALVDAGLYKAPLDAQLTAAKARCWDTLQAAKKQNCVCADSDICVCPSMWDACDTAQDDLARLEALKDKT